ncbi:MAG: hypothetical protein DSM107014_04790 [Gomphosphaeria aponina SAG 52.96 = DSM 107014]|uniref:Uncharacterized protein n=1 Tax=Gomphosphaeria aponina SAG 52.96 = DSM 107014 TaxID=1521640 RepID=A0A941GP01_9CHRO|nr:hypothetical protein [Gomphosphaeria aponina SAG 52.96 = DSM 107014]
MAEGRRLDFYTTINHQLSTINHQLSTINHQPSTINHQPLTINHQPKWHLEKESSGIE